MPAQSLARFLQQLDDLAREVAADGHAGRTFRAEQLDLLSDTLAEASRWLRVLQQGRKASV